MKIAVFYHIRFEGGDPPVQAWHGVKVYREQMAAYERSGLAAAATVITTGVAGDFPEKLGVSYSTPWERVSIGRTDGEAPTLRALQQWIQDNKPEDWAVCYFHAKGVTHPNDRLTAEWRRCMMRVVIENWRQCVKDLEAGYDLVGPHWLTRERYPEVSWLKTPFFGGNFWWARGSYVAALPPLEPRGPMTLAQADAAGGYPEERWIGLGKNPKVKEYARHWPGLAACSQSLRGGG